MGDFDPQTPISLSKSRVHRCLIMVHVVGNSRARSAENLGVSGAAVTALFVIIVTSTAIWVSKASFGLRPECFEQLTLQLNGNKETKPLN